MTLNLNSWHAKYYNRVFGINPPKTLCPYFWTMVVLVLFSPLYFFLLWCGEKYCYVIEKRISHKKPKSNNPVKKKTPKTIRFFNIIETIGIIIIIISLTLTVLLIILTIYDIVSKIGIINLLFITFEFIGFFFVVYQIINLFVKNSLIQKFFNSNFIQIPVQMVIAVYKKACPIVTWVDDTQKQTVNN